MMDMRKHYRVPCGGGRTCCRDFGNSTFWRSSHGLIPGMDLIKGAVYWSPCNRLCQDMPITYHLLLHQWTLRKSYSSKFLNSLQLSSSNYLHNSLSSHRFPLHNPFHPSDLAALKKWKGQPAHYNRCRIQETAMRACAERTTRFNISLPQVLTFLSHGAMDHADMVEMMLMQNAQMHQIIMQNMMLKALPPMAFSHSSNANIHAFQHAQQDSQFVAPVMLKPERNKSSSVHHHHHYMPPSGVPPASNPLPSLTGYSMWPPAMPSNIMGQGLPHTVHHITGPTTMMPTQHTSGWNPSQNAHWTIN
uniref:Uncharacterized protein C21orf58 homolog isoform X1 n=1 Tax=Geotrypetes seraphini TaxID=260995 RepID=A0A6P8QZM9_GEOSA|nr:uncharacterized protein C21orf58 homolog isoform X1 [Geotrypetes seraphini]XP_033802945.1 uncharacterized protein C21orf58 homolog isoform X1 [Geotrypetes seraphini]